MDMDMDAVGPGIWELLLSISYGAIVPIAPDGTLLKYHGAISNGAIYRTCSAPSIMETMTCRKKKLTPLLE
jgi:hypothetical protein